MVLKESHSVCPIDDDDNIIEAVLVVRSCCLEARDVLSLDCFLSVTLFVLKFDCCGPTMAVLNGSSKRADLSLQFTFATFTDLIIDA
ncbi:hypothetical protein DERP_001397 [Dermatophagoides pteronyssinus]|uniref:Uncharacterized protein n=1 Tax=Dermatophagoides pteronyssinus TaxID=6956 RepID=A0ABQ8JEU4_DERPT|nr:hypothetical protein DERP_001397 [Dermatophagoides pteronyssinus]